MKWYESAPANIALIKYMGKLNHQQNVASNPSLSYTLDSLRTYVQIEPSNSNRDSWEPLENEQCHAITLSEHGQQRFLNHLARIKEYFDYQGYFCVRSGNNFPADCGLASSASSFAALTKAAVKAICALKKIAEPSLYEQASLSQKGSGSSCRSFFSPWCFWDGDRIEPYELPYKKLIHQVIVVENRQKAVSSSEAHKRVASSLLFQDRSHRVSIHFNNLIAALRAEDWRRACEIAWIEFWDMHALFHTSCPPFMYMTPDSFAILTTLQEHWAKQAIGPLVTLDAGPNVHLLYPETEKELASQFYHRFSAQFRVIQSENKENNND